jgi:hypothetical protein
MQIIAQGSRNSYCSWLHLVMKLTVTSFVTDLKPTITFELSDYLAHLHNRPKVAKNSQI